MYCDRSITEQLSHMKFTFTRAKVLGLSILAVVIVVLFVLALRTYPTHGANAEIMPFDPQVLAEMNRVMQEPAVVAVREQLNEYLAGTLDPNYEFTPVKKEMFDTQCGLDAFDRDYYEHKFALINGEDAKYGGALLHIIFPDKPDRAFEVWMYPRATSPNSHEWEMRMFCDSELSPEAVGEIANQMRVYTSRPDLITL